MRQPITRQGETIIHTVPLIISKPVPGIADLPALGMDANSIVNDFIRYFSHTLGQDKMCLAAYQVYTSLSMSLRDRLVERWKNTQYAYEEQNCKRTYYLSLEFLMGRALGNAMLNLDVDKPTEEALRNLGLMLEEIADQEHDAGLGNGGLGRLAACFLDSCATLQLPVVGYGIRYEYGMFRQKIDNGRQMEEPDHWLRDGNPWEIERPEHTVRVKFGGCTRYYHRDGRLYARWTDSQDVVAVPYDVPIPGYRNGTVNTLRLWSAAATDEFDLSEFNAGSYTEAVAAKNGAENITMVLYPNDASENGKELRLRQQYFLASASLQDVLRNWVNIHGSNFENFAEKNCFQLNDTHPTCAVPELMRLLMDKHFLDWDQAWAITSRTVAYTNHTLLPEALERWPVSMFGRLLPRLLDIIHEINARFLADVAQRWPGDTARQRRMSIIEEGDEAQIRMAYLAVVSSASVNGVAELHSHLLQLHLFHDFYEMWPSKFNNKTNGVTPRRWMAWSNPGLNDLITRTIGDGWVTDLTRLRKLAPHADKAKFRAEWRAVKQANKARLAEMVQRDCSIAFDTEALFDVQVKRIHEYKRQLLNVLHVIHLYDRIKRGDTADWTPRCVLIGGKAAPGYMIAKCIIKLVNSVAKVINEDPAAQGLLKLAFFPDYRVSAMEVICPGTDLSEQISTAGKEASGTGNMKFMMNGALTIGTLDGANIEIREEAGEENFFLFGLTAEEVDATRPNYNPAAIIAADEDLRRVMQLLESGHFNLFEPGIFDPIIHAVTSPHDPWLTAADFRGYIDAQQQVARAYRDQENWTRMSILNTAASGKFSSDRTILDYNRDIWHLSQVPAWPVK
ncbi:glycogen/starch/alpha-glucan phosphorylase [Sulfuricella denitrificans skB26]|uniref:Alpha-1,4 glucan phosphorylase n=2 Tax=Sulfuricella denitrificans TaxID=649841 RepID=S6AAY3_SULDS|nr:glycogen/starch/alpha-glucan phosphorylase [Sulfuricella denitrificans]BAN34148.1 glycogen/starch/alpha-glucan phosphorylase [Sulfuricella denitrificans skB26]